MNALNIFESVDDVKKDVITIGAMMKAFIDNEEDGKALELYNKYDMNMDDICHVLASLLNPH